MEQGKVYTKPITTPLPSPRRIEVQPLPRPWTGYVDLDAVRVEVGTGGPSLALNIRPRRERGIGRRIVRVITGRK